MLTLAHGLVQRSDLPIPDVVFAWAAAIVLVASFAGLAVLWPTPRLQDAGWRPLGAFGRLVGSRAVEIVAGLIGVLGLVLILWTGWFGAQDGLDNPSAVTVYIVVWVGFAIVSLPLGDVFRAFNPWRAVGRVAGVVMRRGGRMPRPYPEQLGCWPAALVLLVFTWTELVGRWGDAPTRIATGLAVYSALTWAGMAVYGVETWVRRAEGFGVYFSLFGRLAPLEVRDRTLGVRPFLSGLPRMQLLPGTVAVIVVAIGTVTFDGLSQGPAWTSGLGPALTDGFAALGFGGSLAGQLAGTVGLLCGPLLIGGFYALGISGAETVGGGFTSARLRRAFAHTLVPIALVYVFAHYLTALVFEGQTVAYLASDPLGDGWDLFGTASGGIDYGLLGQNAIWYLQVGFVVLGHVAGLVLAHDRALALYEDPQEAVRSQYWLLGVMVGFTSLALWLLASLNT